jgi:arabinogalactan oligomer/maltooligosaccharide transport system permease protein
MTAQESAVRRPADKQRERRAKSGSGAIRRSFDKYWYAYAMAAPVAVVLVVLVGYPFAWGMYLSLTNATEANMGRDIGVNHIPATYKFVGLDNFTNILSGADGHFYSTLSWTLIWTFVCVFFHVAIGLGLAILINRRVRFRAGYRLMLILPWAIPGFVAAFAWRLLYNDNGVFNALLKSAGLHGTNWLAQPTSAKFAVIAVNVWMGVPFMMVSFLGGLQSIPAERYEAAEMDGATPWQRFLYITLPGLRPVMMTVTLLGIIWTFNKFDVIFLVTEGGPAGSTDILVTHAYELAFANIRQYAQAASYGVVILSMLLVFATVYRRTLSKSEVSA